MVAFGKNFAAFGKNFAAFGNNLAAFGNNFAALGKFHRFRRVDEISCFRNLLESNLDKNDKFCF